MFELPQTTTQVSDGWLLVDPSIRRWPNIEPAVGERLVFAGI